MSQTLQKIQELVKRGDIRVSEHGYDELAADELFIREIIDGTGDAVQIEDYPDYFKGPCVLVLQTDAAGLPIHGMGNPQECPCSGGSCDCLQTKPR